MSDQPVQQVGGAIIVQGQHGLDQLAKCVLAQIRETQRNGYSVVPYAELLRTIHSARMSQPRHELASYQLVQAHSESQDVDDWIGVAEAAEALGVGIRQMQRLAHSLSPGQAKRIGNSWTLRRRTSWLYAKNDKGRQKMANDKTPDDSYPAAWRPPQARSQNDGAAPGDATASGAAAALGAAVDVFIAGLTDEEFKALVSRTRSAK
jgi:hypothetical protein